MNAGIALYPSAPVQESTHLLTTASIGGRLHTLARPLSDLRPSTARLLRSSSQRLPPADQPRTLTRRCYSALLNKIVRISVALTDIELDLPYGRYGLVGGNGAGKSTLIRIVLGLETPDSGEVQLFGEHPKATRNLLARVGYMPEKNSIPSDLNAFEYVRLAQCSVATKPGSDACIDRTLHEVGPAGA
ncbi:MAG: ATP-binding cassette domain-containing protein [Polyangiales bacterium]